MTTATTIAADVALKDTTRHVLVAPAQQYLQQRHAKGEDFGARAVFGALARNVPRAHVTKRANKTEAAPTTAAAAAAAKSHPHCQEGASALQLACLLLRKQTRHSAVD